MDDQTRSPEALTGHWAPAPLPGTSDALLAGDGLGSQSDEALEQLFTDGTSQGRSRRWQVLGVIALLAVVAGAAAIGKVTTAPVTVVSTVTEPTPTTSPLATEVPSPVASLTPEAAESVGESEPGAAPTSAAAVPSPSGDAPGEVSEPAVTEAPATPTSPTIAPDPPVAVTTPAEVPGVVLLDAGDTRILGEATPLIEVTVAGVGEWEARWPGGYLASYDGRPQLLPAGTDVAALDVRTDFGRTPVDASQVTSAPAQGYTLRILGSISEYSLGSTEEGSRWSALAPAPLTQVNRLLILGDPNRFGVSVQVAGQTLRADMAPLTEA